MSPKPMIGQMMIARSIIDGVGSAANVARRICIADSFEYPVIIASGV